MSRAAKIRLRVVAIVVGSLLMVPAAARAQNVAQTQAGLKLAQQYCTECHVVAPSASKGWTDAPPFTVVANRPTSTIASLSTFIQQPHMHMLNTGRPPAEAHDIAAYIVSLRTKAGSLAK